jgi:hypothetical protein
VSQRCPARQITVQKRARRDRRQGCQQMTASAGDSEQGARRPPGESAPGPLLNIMLIIGTKEEGRVQWRHCCLPVHVLPEWAGATVKAGRCARRADHHRRPPSAFPANTVPPGPGLGTHIPGPGVLTRTARSSMGRGYGRRVGALAAALARHSPSFSSYVLLPIRLRTVTTSLPRAGGRSPPGRSQELSPPRHDRFSCLAADRPAAARIVPDWRDDTAARTKGSIGDGDGTQARETSR